MICRRESCNLKDSIQKILNIFDYTDHLDPALLSPFTILETQSWQAKSG